MILKNFYFNIFIRVTLIVLSCLALGIVLQHLDSGYYYTLTGMIFLIAFQAWLLINQVNKTNNDLEKFLASVQDHDSSFRFPEKYGDKSFRKLHDKMNHLNTLIQDVKIENQQTRHFLQRVVDHVDIGLISFDNDGLIGIYNKAAQHYFTIHQPGQIFSLKKENNELSEIITAIKPGKEILYKMNVDNLTQSILVKATELKFENNMIRLVSLENITTELDKKELDSWQRLIRVLTHEIMNSISPVTSLTSVISGYFTHKETGNTLLPEEIDYQIIYKTLSGLNTIEETGNGLLNFVNHFRSLTSLPRPNLSNFTIDSLFLKCKLLMESTVSGNVKIVIHVFPEDLTLVADVAQVEQILLNLIKNAAEAIGDKESGTIQMDASYGDGGIMIHVEDNGIGISDEIIDDIFVPFYTTKENGSGIGLSLSKQIMQNHNGTISVNSVLNKGSRFTLKFKL